MKTKPSPTTDAAPATKNDLTRSDMEVALVAVGWRRGAANDDPEKDGSLCWYNRRNDISVIFDADDKLDEDGIPKATYSEVMSDHAGMRLDYAQILLLVTGRSTLAQVRRLHEQKHAPALPAGVEEKLQGVLALSQGQGEGDVFSRAKALPGKPEPRSKAKRRGVDVASNPEQNGPFHDEDTSPGSGDE